MGARWLIGLTAVLMSSASTGDQMQVDLWNVRGISSSMWESHPAIDPRTGDLWFVRSDTTFSGWKLYRAACVQGRWTDPKPAPIAGNGLEADPWFSNDGKTLWIISTGAGGSPESKALDVWRVTRDAAGRWSAPERLPAPINSDFTEWFPRVAPDHWLYFGSRRPGGFGKDDIWRARQDRKGNWAVENVGAGLNSNGAEYEFQPAPDGRWGVLATDSGLFRVVRTRNGWERSRKYDAPVNVNGTEIGPMITKNGRALIFSRDAGEGRSGELYIAGGSKVGDGFARTCS